MIVLQRSARVGLITSPLSDISGVPAAFGAQASIWFASWQHVSAVTSVFPHWVSSSPRTSVQFICQRVSTLQPDWPTFCLLSLNLCPLLFLTGCFPHTSPFPEVLPCKPRNIFFFLLKGWAIVSCFRGEGGREESASLPGCQRLALCRWEKKQTRQMWWWRRTREAKLNWKPLHLLRFSQPVVQTQTYVIFFELAVLVQLSCPSRAGTVGSWAPFVYRRQEIKMNRK